MKLRIENANAWLVSGDFKIVLISIFVLFSHPFISACTTLSIASMAVNTSVKTATSLREQKEAEEKMNANIARTNLNLGIEHMRQGNYDRALDTLTVALEAGPEIVAVHNVLGLLKQNMELYIEAEDHFFNALKLEPDNPDTLNNYGQFLCRQGNESQAIKYFLRSANNSLYDKSELPYTNAGLCVLKENNYIDAEKYFRSALESNPNIPIALLKMSRISFEKENYLEAKEYLSRYDQLTRHNAESLWLGIEIENMLGNKDAVSSYALLLKIDFPEAEETAMLKRSGIR